MCSIVFFFKQKTAYELRMSDWSSDGCSSDLAAVGLVVETCAGNFEEALVNLTLRIGLRHRARCTASGRTADAASPPQNDRRVRNDSFGIIVSLPAGTFYLE